MNPGLWIDAIVQWGAAMPHTVFAVLWAKALTLTLILCDRRPWPDRAYYGVYAFTQALAGFVAAGWSMRLVS